MQEKASGKIQHQFTMKMLQKMGTQETYLNIIKKLCIPMEQDREPRDKPTHLWVPYF